MVFNVKIQVNFNFNEYVKLAEFTDLPAGHKFYPHWGQFFFLLNLFCLFFNVNLGLKYKFDRIVKKLIESYKNSGTFLFLV